MKRIIDALFGLREKRKYQIDWTLLSGLKCRSVLIINRCNNYMSCVISMLGNCSQKKINSARAYCKCSSLSLLSRCPIYWVYSKHEITYYKRNCSFWTTFKLQICSSILVVRHRRHPIKYYVAPKPTSSLLSSSVTN